MQHRKPMDSPRLSVVATSPSVPPPSVAAERAPVPGDLLRSLVGLVLKAAPAKGEGAKLFFDAEPSGQPIVAAHDEQRCHIAFFSMEAAILFRGAVERASVRKLYRLLGSVEELEESSVAVDEDGRVRITRPAQPALHHQLVLVPSLMDWRPPSDLGAVDVPVPLIVSADHLRDASRLKFASVSMVGRSSARLIVNATLGGEVVFRAILAEHGHVLYDADARQKNLPGVGR